MSRHIYKLTASDKALRDAIAACRNSVRTKNTKEFNGDDVYANNRIGASGEVAFARLYGLPLPKAEALIHGDGGVDFRFTRHNGKHKYTVDVKTRRHPQSLPVKEHQMERCAHIVVLCHFIDDDTVEFIGWQTNTKMADADLRDLGHGPCYCCPRGDLRDMDDIAQFIAGRDK